jgi:catechol 2,3-dioxygenase-like lactoylglutathione lyase family enzyme
VISGVHQVVLYVADQQQAKQFWTEKMGFEVVQDAPYGEDQRWVEVATPDGRMRLVLSTRLPGWSMGETPDGMPTSNVFFYSDDIESTYQQLSARGVKFPTPPVKMHFGWWSVFEDDEGTRYALNNSEPAEQD